MASLLTWVDNFRFGQFHSQNSLVNHSQCQKLVQSYSDEPTFVPKNGCGEAKPRGIGQIRKFPIKDGGHQNIKTKTLPLAHLFISHSHFIHHILCCGLCPPRPIGIRTPNSSIEYVQQLIRGIVTSQWLNGPNSVFFPFRVLLAPAIWFWVSGAGKEKFATARPLSRKEEKFPAAQPFNRKQVLFDQQRQPSNRNHPQSAQPSHSIHSPVQFF